MIIWLAYGVLGLAAVSIVWGLVTAAANKPPGKAQLIFAAVVELATVAQTVSGLVLLALGRPTLGLATTIGYLIVIVIFIPIAWFWANSERTRHSGLVLAVAALAVLGMTLRLLTLMPAGG